MPFTSSVERKKPIQADVSVDVLTEIVKSVFSTMMSLEVSTTDAPWNPKGEWMTSMVYLMGDWNGVVMLACNPHQACQFAGRILCMDPPESADDDVRDVLGELANIIGGNMKSRMTTVVRLSLPSVLNGRDYDVKVCGSRVLERLAYQCEDGTFWVTILVNKE
jgi:chemotaxis protein CheX